MKGWSVIGQGRSARRRFSSKRRRLSAPGLREVNVTPLRPADIYILADGRSRICRLTGQGPPLLINACIGRMSRSWSELDTPGWREWRKWPVADLGCAVQPAMRLHNGWRIPLTDLREIDILQSFPGWPEPNAV